MSSQPVTVYLGIGSNQGDRKKNLDMALKFLTQRMRLGKCSSIYDTEPVGMMEGTQRFLNMVCQAFTMLPPTGLLAVARAVESKLGRVPLPDKGPAPRPIDVDILLYGDQIVKADGLIIPHPRLAERAFVLMPLAELAPDFKHPALGKTIKELLAEVDGKAGVIKVG
ncbi:MAG: 2-amino-4-hydroxy-6-hydroxymethyldihydropteridine diphosphokinase [Chloroflexi bacterium]|nr:2-amino-4-hydroxy-6-hydroxymethyldihydropteridine diphosphokinase [Chloroflexota bacterium]